MADIALAGRVIASHYAEPVEKQVAQSVTLRSGPSDSSEAISQLVAGEPFRMLDDTLGWAWGYAGETGRVGYADSEAIGSRRPS